MLVKRLDKENRQAAGGLLYVPARNLPVEHVPYGQPAPGALATRAAEGPSTVFEVATYNVHRWAGLTGGRKWCPELATAVVAELETDIIALQEVLRPLDAEDPLERLARDLALHYAFVPARPHRRGTLGNAILSRWPMAEVFTIDLSFSRLEWRSAIATRFTGPDHTLSVVATHLALVDRTRRRQVNSLLEHPQLEDPTVLLGDMNAWRRCRAMRQLDREFMVMHHNRNWPPSYPATRPMLALDRIYARGARVIALRNHLSPAARRGSDHLPVIATVKLTEADEVSFRL